MPVHNNWQIARLDRRMSGDPMIGAAGAMLGLLWNPVEISGYDIGFLDGTGAPLHGNNRYVLRLDPPPPVNAFWSLTLYSAKTGFLTANPINRYSVGDRTPGIVYGENGKLSIFIQHEMPTDPTERANWLPAPAEPYYLIIRYYSPRAPLLTGDWMPPALMAR
jgi:hypothetical protein